MSVFVVMTVRPPDPSRFEGAAKELLARDTPAGARGRFWGKREDDPGTYIMGGEWDSHDAMHAYSDEVGDQFNRDAGTEDVEWETTVWQVGGTAG